MLKEAVPQKNIPGRSKDGRPNSYADGNNGREDIGRAQSTSVKSFGMQRKDKNDIHFDMRQQVKSLAFDSYWKWWLQDT